MAHFDLRSPSCHHKKMDLNHLAPVNLVDVYSLMSDASPMASDIDANAATEDTTTTSSGEDVIVVGLSLLGLLQTLKRRECSILSKRRSFVERPSYGPFWRNRKGTKQCSLF